MITKPLTPGHGPLILEPDGKLGHIQCKFPDRGSYPVWKLLEAYFRDMGATIAAASLARYTLVCFDPAISTGHNVGVDDRFFIPEEWAKVCAVPMLVSVSSNVATGGAWVPTFMTTGHTVEFVVDDDQNQGLGRNHLYMNAAGGDEYVKAALIFPPWKAEDFRFGGVGSSF